jgi:acetyl esterase/lipase
MYYSVWFTRITFILLIALVSNLVHASKRTKNISYIPANSSVKADPERHLLDVYAPNKKPQTPLPVVVFIHGGNWNSGSKNTYWFIGRRLASQGVVAVVINYRLSPNVLVPDMALDCARAVQWTSQHIGEYGGDPNRIYVMGHSAGGGLAALLATDNELFTRIDMAKNPVKGAILDDPAGINMYDYLLKMEYPDDKKYLVSFGKDPAGWKAASPLFKVRAGLPPMLLYSGERTYPSIITGTKAFRDKLQSVGANPLYRELPGKKHVPMVTQLFWKRNIIYRDLLALVRG